MKPYQKVVEYHFEVQDETIAITDIGNDFVCVEEVRKNGQEDSHMVGVLSRTADNTFEWKEGERMFVEYGSQELADGICAYLSLHGVPGDGEGPVA